MQEQQFTKPFYIFLLVLPAGISFGFVSVALPYLLIHRGFSVEATAAIVSIGVSANLWRFVWGPVADLTLTIRKWYGIAVAACVITLLLLCSIPFTTKGSVLLTVIVFISQIAATFVMLPVGSIMANRIEAHKKGRAGGWFQAANVGGTGLGGGAGLWLTTHYNIMTAGIVLCVACVLCGLIVLAIKDVQRDHQETVVHEIKMMGKDIWSMLKVPLSLFVIILILLPIGTGAASNLWSAIAADWKTDADTVALVTGILSGVVGIAGSIIGGFIADKWGNWIAYLGSGILCALVTIIMAILPYQPSVYIGGVLAYSFALGLLNAAFSSVLLFAIGKKNAATKYSLLSSIGNLPVVYMTAFDGWAHDHYNSKYMLLAEAAVGILFVVICVIVLNRMIAKKLIPKTVD
jgi:MFS transporter, PAT family, beta-lactamase induction signal transducer AmpG